MKRNIDATLKMYYQSSENTSKEELIEVLETLSYDLSIVTETASIAQYANFDLKVSYIDDDIYAFIEDYVNTIASKQKRWGLNITYFNSERENLKVEFLPSEICTFISNILDNARKNNAKNVKIICGNRKIIFEDNGDGFDFQTFSAEDFLKKGITTTYNGSGLGLYHNKIIAEKINAKINLRNSEQKKGAIIEMEFNK